MKCPSCDIALSMSNREGIEIDYCPQCRGVWLDRGELDKIIERSMTTQSRTGRHDDDWDDDDDDVRRGPFPKKRDKRSGLLGELFDFG